MERNAMTVEDALIEQVRVRASDAKKRHDFANSFETHLPPPATATRVESAEGRLSFPLPRLLRRLYVEVANGGFGPGYGLLGVDGGYVAEEGGTIVESRDFLASICGDSQVEWPSKTIPLCSWGSSVWSCLDCGSNEGTILTLQRKASPGRKTPCTSGSMPGVREFLCGRRCSSSMRSRF